MSGLRGCRNVQVLTSVSSGTLGTPSMYVEVTNNNATDILIYINDYPDQGHPTAGVASQGIPIKAGTTREIPMYVYNFTATGAVTVVAYTA